MGKSITVGSNGGKLVFASNIVANPGASLTLGVNDSGPILTEAFAFTEWLIQPVGTWGGGTAAVQAYVLGTSDPDTTGYSGALGKVAATQKNYFPIVAQAQESTGDTFTWDNPLLGNNASSLSTLQAFFADGSNITDSLSIKLHGLTAIRIIVVTAGASGSATNPNCNLLVFAID